MALRWINIRTGLKTIAETEPQIAALWSSSDHSPNITQGQDFGWRLAPEVVVEMKRIKQDFAMLERIAGRFKKALDDLSEIDILHYISNKTTLEAAPQPEVNQFEDEYDAEIRKLENKGQEVAHNLFDDVQQGVKPLAAMTDAELEAELAARRKRVAPSTTTTTTEAPTTTTTTTSKPEEQ